MKWLTLFFLHTDKQAADVDADACASGRVCVNAPCDRQLDVVHQVLAAVTDGAGFKALTLTGSTPARQEVSLEKDHLYLHNRQQN